MYFGVHIAKFAHDLIVIQFVDRYKQVKNNAILQFGSLKGDRIRYREETALYRSTYRTYPEIFSESCSVAVIIYRVTAIYRAVIYRLTVFFCF